MHAVRIFRAKKPIVAAVHGAAIGGGLGLAVSADFRVTCPGRASPPILQNSASIPASA
jgi:enoyl-CoA hydratase/carnithine racemase